MTVLFGGDACPLGLSLQFLEAPRGRGRRCATWQSGRWSFDGNGFYSPQALSALLPFQAPWTRMLTAQVGRWTALANNGIHGGDGTAPGPAVSRALGVRCVVATHAPRQQSAQTQLEVIGPGGEPPLMYIRSISATATDGRWEWHESGEPLPFEETERYGTRIKRNRFDRAMLLTYLIALGIPVDDDAYGTATLHQEHVSWSSREVSLDEERRVFGL
ncbi:MAG: hypothetical protein R2734_00055 [Nocardioides sp.]